MNFALECRKMRRTGFFSAFIAGGILAASLPVINMAVRWEIFTGLQQSPLQILLNENWTMIAMLNILLIVSGACIMYHTENADNAIQRMHSLPIKESNMFFSKFILITGMSIIILFTESLTILFCCLHWFKPYEGLYLDLLKNFGYFLIMLLPTILLSLAISSACSNMWISLGIGVVFVFTATLVISAKHFMILLFPFALPFQMLVGTAPDRVTQFLIASGIEILIIGIAEIAFLRIRRCFS